MVAKKTPADLFVVGLAVCAEVFNEDYPPFKEHPGNTKVCLSRKSILQLGAAILNKITYTDKAYLDGVELHLAIDRLKRAAAEEDQP